MKITLQLNDFSVATRKRAGARLRQVGLQLAALVAMLMLAGCYEMHYGHYVPSQAAGWSRQEDYGLYYFHYPTKGTPGWFVQVGGTQKGTLKVEITSWDFDPYAIWTSHWLRFSGEPIRIISADDGKESVVPADGFQTLFGQKVDVGSSQDFLVILPFFRIGTNPVPSLTVHVRWSDGKYRIWIPLS
jgi:hypothetical protein